MISKRLQNFLIFACAFLWIIMMGSKNVYTAELVEIMGVFGVSKPDASLAMTYYFLTYSTVQVILFFIMDSVNLKWFMFISMFFSGFITIIIAFATGMWQLWWILALNGILQAGVWGICLAVLKKYLPPSAMAKANMIMNVGMAIAGIISYGSSALFVSIGRWDLPFIVLGAVLSLSAVIFFVAVHKCEKCKVANTNKVNINEIAKNTPDIITLNSSTKRILFFIISFIFSVFIHFVFYGTMNWMPNLLTENFGLENSVGILISILAPLATVIGPIIAIYHCEKKPNFLLVSLTYLALATVLSLLMVFVFDLNLIISAVVLILFLVIMQGVITIVFSVLSIKMGKFINTGAHAGLMNAAGGYSAGFAPTIIGAIIENNGWQFSYFIIFAICLVTTLALAILTALLKKK